MTGSGLIVCLIGVDPEPKTVLDQLLTWRSGVSDDIFAAQWQISARWSAAEYEERRYARLDVDVSSPANTSFALLLDADTAAAPLRLAAEGEQVLITRQSVIERADQMNNAGELLAECLIVPPVKSRALLRVT